MLSVSDLDLFYGDAQALADVSLEVRQGEIVAIVGANGAGKSSLIRAIAGIEQPRRGRIVFKDKTISGLESHEICNLGIGQVAEGRQVFPGLTVLENLQMGAMVPRARFGEAQPRRRIRDVSTARRTQSAVCRHDVGRRTADARHRPLPDGRARAHHVR